MQPDPMRVEEVKAWLAKAARDLSRVELMLAAEPADVEGALFHAQQTAEKALKGFLTWHDVPFRKTHDLGVLGAQCAEVDATLAELVGRTDPLTDYAWRFRYPGAPYEPGREEAEGALAVAREVLGAVAARLPEEVRP